MQNQDLKTDTHFDVSKKTLGRPEKIGKQVWASVFLVRHLWVKINLPVKDKIVLYESSCLVRGHV